MDLIEIASARKDQLPFAKTTAYSWHSKGKHPGLIIKVAGKLFFNKTEWARMAKAARAAEIKRSADQ